MIKIRFILASTLLLCSAFASQAEVISIADPRYDVANSPEGVVRPTQGMTMAEVEQKFGPAEQKNPAVGEPPITRWVYKDFVVFFEHNQVIHSVVPH
ncbi:MAG: hypothetical protein OEY48_02990 [Gammaproteobacteria bacterium]|nr:hypothetical protein [Gammaproteobacteria bacterium]MDH5591794.1 hypothetical protein [Gammaproteobacteria bacterium]